MSFPDPVYTPNPIAEESLQSTPSGRSLLFPWETRNKGEDFGRLKYAKEEELLLSQLPCLVYTLRGERVRVISARDMTRRERRDYVDAEAQELETDPEV